MVEVDNKVGEERSLVMSDKFVVPFEVDCGFLFDPEKMVEINNMTAITIKPDVIRKKKPFMP